MKIKLRDNVTQKDFKSATFEERDVDKVSVDILKKCKIRAGVTTGRIENIWLVKIEGNFEGRTLFYSQKDFEKIFERVEEQNETM